MRSIEPLFVGLMLCSALSAGPTFPAVYAGSQACVPCHEDLFNSLMKTPHSQVEKGMAAGPKGEWKEHACESCHGPGAKHAGSADITEISNPAKLRSPLVDAACLACHKADQTHAGRLTGTHAKQGVSCVACHVVHADGGHSLVTRGAEGVNAQCSACHRNVWASFQKPFGHRLTTNSMSCVDCHNPHGAVRASVHEPSCFRCHGDKRGPFTFEHAPVRLEGCGSCHEPHGSVNPRLLTRHEVRLVCLECHANLPAPNAKNAALGVVPPSFHDLRSPRYQYCTVCHQSVHGSYTDRNLIR